jgi:EAL domain-containing protein (putative c-di-GMP-specific phosphodiesterase class I)
VDILKIDRSFIGKLQGGPTETAIVEAVAGLGHGLGMQVVAEGIETAEQLEQTRTLGCDRGQGYYFSRPMPAEEADALLARRLMLLAGGLPSAYEG